MLLQKLNSIQIEKVLQNDKRCKRYFIGVYPCDKIPKKIKVPSCFVINTDNSQGPGEHWVCVFMDNKRTCFFFDSFGLSPKYYDLDKKLKVLCVSLKWNKKIYQPIYSTSCGYYVLLFLLLKARKIDMNSLKINEKIILNIFKMFKY